MPSTTGIYTLSLHDALPIWMGTRSGTTRARRSSPTRTGSRRSRTSGSSLDRSEEHTSELQSPCNLVCRLPPGSTRFPYTTLFRSGWARGPALLERAGRALPGQEAAGAGLLVRASIDRKSTRLNSSHLVISYAVYHRDLHAFPTRRSSDLDGHGVRHYSSAPVEPYQDRKPPEPDFWFEPR